MTSNKKLSQWIEYIQIEADYSNQVASPWEICDSICSHIVTEIHCESKWKSSVSGDRVSALSSVRQDESYWERDVSSGDSESVNYIMCHQNTINSIMTTSMRHASQFKLNDYSWLIQYSRDVRERNGSPSLTVMLGTHDIKSGTRSAEALQRCVEKIIVEVFRAITPLAASIEVVNEHETAAGAMFNSVGWAPMYSFSRHIEEALWIKARTARDPRIRRVGWGNYLPRECVEALGGVTYIKQKVDELARKSQLPPKGFELCRPMGTGLWLQLSSHPHFACGGSIGPGKYIAFWLHEALRDARWLL